MTVDELNVECQAILNSLAFSIYSKSLPAFNILFEYGFRVSELYSLKHSSLIDEQVYIQTNKRGQERVFLIDEISFDLHNAIFNHSNFYLPKPDTLRSNFKVVVDGSYRCLGKNVSTHIFRHNRIKQEYLINRDKGSLSRKMGLNSTSVLDKYIYSNIIKHDA